jgi:Protein of unknown function (DUF1559)
MSRRAKLVILIAAAVLLLSCAVFLPCIQTVRDGEGWGRSAHTLHVTGHAINAYHEVDGHVPWNIAAKDGNLLLSWRVDLLPFTEEDRLYKEFRLDEPWDSKRNHPLLLNGRRAYQPILGGRDAPGLTRYQGFVGPGTAFERNGLTWADFTDGRSNTLLVVEAAEPVPWTKPADLTYDPKGPLPALGGAWTKPVHFMCREVRRDPGFVACFADGSVRFIRQSVDEKVLRALITRNGGEAVDPSDAE